MKKIYSTILLFAFLVGALQPILPMIEHHLFEGSLIELVTTGEVSTTDSESHELGKVSSSQQDHNRAPQKNLLDTDYYPLALDIVTMPKPDAFFIGSRYYLPSISNIISPTFLPNPPPPRLS